MKQVERPSPVLVAALDHDFDGLTNAAVGLDSRIPQVVEAPQDDASVIIESLTEVPP